MSDILSKKHWERDKPTKGQTYKETKRHKKKDKNIKSFITEIEPKLRISGYS